MRFRRVGPAKLRHRVLKGVIRARNHPLFPCRHPGFLSQSQRYRPRSPRPPTRGRRAETKTAATTIELLGPTLLDDTPPVLVPLYGRPGHREARHRDRLAPRRLPPLLALAIPAAGRPTEDHRGDSRSDPTLGAREPELGAPKIHGELQKLGLVVSERSVARYLRRIRRHGDAAKCRLTFLQNHREVIAAFDFFTVPTVTFQLLYCFFVIEHGRRRILHFNVTYHHTAECH
jgi:hypothetical protein